jgi:hypothetical protein
MSRSGASYEQAALQQMRALPRSRRSNLIPKIDTQKNLEEFWREGLHYMKLTRENPRG